MNNLLMGLIIFFSILAIIVTIWCIDWKPKKKEKSWFVSRPAFSALKLLLFMLTIFAYIYSKRHEIEKFFGLIILSIPLFFLFMHVRSLSPSFLQYFYFSLIILGWLAISSYMLLHEDTTKQQLNKKRKELIMLYSSNAPKPPKEWEPINLTPKPHTPSIWTYVFGNGSNHKHKEFIRTHYNDESEEFIIGHKAGYRKLNPEEIPEGLVQEMEQWSKDWEKQTELIKIWEHEHAMQRIIQWRFYYAEYMTNQYLKIHKQC